MEIKKTNYNITIEWEDDAYLISVNNGTDSIIVNVVKTFKEVFDYIQCVFDTGNRDFSNQDFTVGDSKIPALQWISIVEDFIDFRCGIIFKPMNDKEDKKRDER